jgi:hypothetical protein
MTEQAHLIPSPPLTGACQCPSNPITYTVSSQPHSLNACHCHECQRQSGSAFALTLVVPSSGLTISARSVDNIRTFERKTNSGGVRRGVFCSKCGVRLWHYDPAKPEWASVKAGTLDQKVDFGAAQHIWTKQMLKGMILPKDLVSYKEEPNDGPL